MTITRRDLFRAAAATGIAAVVGPAITAPSPDVFSVADLLRAEAILNAHAVQHFGGGLYTIFLHPKSAEDITLDSLTVNATYRVRETAWSLMRHERLREDMGKRGHVTAADVFARVAEGYAEPVALPFPIEVFRA